MQTIPLEEMTCKMNIYRLRITQKNPPYLNVILN